MSNSLKYPTINNNIHIIHMILSDIHNKSGIYNLYIKIYVDNCDVIHIFCKNCGKVYENVHKQKNDTRGNLLVSSQS